MAYSVRRRLELGRIRRLSRRGSFAALAIFGATMAAQLAPQSAAAQVIIGGHRGPAVSVDNGVLDRLGPAPTLPQLFNGLHKPSQANRQVATTNRSTHRAAPSAHKRTRTHHVAARHRPAARKVAIVRPRPARAPQSSLNQVIHLIPPSARLASAAPIPAAAAVSHQEAALSALTSPTVAALAAPAPARQPAVSEIPTPPLLPPQPAPESAPPTAVAPPSQPVALSRPTTLVPETAPALPANPPRQAIAIAAAAPGPSVAAMSTPAVATAPSVQKAAATTVGSSISAIKFNPGATELGASPQPVLDALVARLLGNETLRVQIIAHAAGGPDEAMESRRISLARAVAVRAYFIEKGVRSLRIDVRALGNRADDAPATDQVDLLVVSQ
jgi:outer membrane protein OmpA-like peptidoglycan-associated protein